MIPIIVISLREAQDRRTRIEKIFKELNLDFEFFDAVDGRQFDVLNHPNYDAPKRRRSYGRDLTGGDIGILLSNKAIFERIVKEDIPYTLILEDDVILREDFFPVLKKILTMPVPFDMIRFLGSPKLERLKLRNVCKIDDAHHLVRHTGIPGGSHAILMTPTGAKKLLKHMNKNAYPMDVLMSRSWLTGLNWFTVRPGLAAQDLSFESTIGDVREQKDLHVTGLAKDLFPLTRAWFKFTESILKKYWFYKTYLRDRKYKDKQYG